MPCAPSSSRKRPTTYVYHPDIGNFQLNDNGLMKPHRASITHELVKSYNLLDQMRVIKPPADTIKQVGEELTAFHSDEYIEFLKSIRLDDRDNRLDDLYHHNVGGGTYNLFHAICTHFIVYTAWKTYFVCKIVRSLMGCISLSVPTPQVHV